MTTQQCWATRLLRTDSSDTGKFRTCSRPNGHTGRHMTHYCGKRRYWNAPPATSPEEISRKQFEHWFQNNVETFERDGETYKDRTAQDFWAGWQARAALTKEEAR